MKLTSKTINYTVDTIEQLLLTTGTENDTVIVTDENRGGVFVYREDNSSTNNGGTIFNGWTRQYDGAVNVKWFGAKGDGVTDDTVAINKALEFSNGSLIYIPVGVFRITSNLTAGSGIDIRIKGSSPIYKSHGLISDSYSSIYTENIPALVSEYTIIKCDNTNMIGSPDTTTCNQEMNLKSLENVLVWGTNGAKHGVYYSPNDTYIKNCSFALFEEFGILQRGGITSEISNCGFSDNGWNLANSGTVGEASSYVSGCAIKLVSNTTPNNYYLIDPNNRVTTTTITNVYSVDRHYTSVNKSGLRCLQASGAIGLNINSLGSYSGCFFDTCEVNIDGYYIESYNNSGFNHGDSTPYAFYLINSASNFGTGHIQSAYTMPEPIKVVTTEPSWLISPYSHVQASNGIDKSIGAKYSNMRKKVAIITSGGTDSYYFKNVLSTVTNKGFLGMIPISLAREANLANQSKGIWLMGRNGYSADLTPTALIFSNVGVGTYAGTITPSFSGNDLKIDITWGSGWGNGDIWILEVGMFGADVFSV